MRRRACLLARLALLALPAAAHAAPQTRPVAAAELAAFHAYYQKRFPDDHAAQPRFVIERASAAAPWNVAAVVDSAPRRGYRQLCRMRRIDFAYANEAVTWNAAEPARQFVWLNPAAGCAVLGQPVELVQRMPDTELAGVLGQQAQILASARLLMAGNTACARQRSHPFVLNAVDVGASGSGAEEMLALLYRSDRAGKLTVWARRTGAEYSAWNVSCPP